MGVDPYSGFDVVITVVSRVRANAWLRELHAYTIDKHSNIDNSVKHDERAMSRWRLLRKCRVESRELFTNVPVFLIVERRSYKSEWTLYQRNCFGTYVFAGTFFNLHTAESWALRLVLREHRVRVV